MGFSQCKLERLLLDLLTHSALSEDEALREKVVEALSCAKAEIAVHDHECLTCGCVPVDGHDSTTRVVAGALRRESQLDKSAAAEG